MDLGPTSRTQIATRLCSSALRVGDTNVETSSIVLIAYTAEDQLLDHDAFHEPEPTGPRKYRFVEP